MISFIFAALCFMAFAPLALAALSTAVRLITSFVCGVTSLYTKAFERRMIAQADYQTLILPYVNWSVISPRCWGP